MGRNGKLRQNTWDRGCEVCCEQDILGSQVIMVQAMGIRAYAPGVRGQVRPTWPQTLQYLPHSRSR